MGTPGPSSEVTLEDALDVFTNLDEPSTPLTATEVAGELNCTRQAARRKLEELGERGDLGEKQPGSDDRVWWRPLSALDRNGGEAGEPPRPAEFGDFVTAVEEYAIFALDADGTVATWNEGARRIKGYEESEILGEHFSSFYTPEDRENGVPDENLTTAADEGKIEDEGWRVRADGTRFWANVVITAIRDDDGELQGFTKVTRDMTERREYEQRLEHERNRFRELLDTAPIPIAVQDAAGKTVEANERAEEALGLTEEEIVEGLENEEEWAVYDADGEPMHPEEGPAARVLETGEPVYEKEIAIEDPSGERSWYSINAAPFAASDEAEEGVVVAGEDVTALKERQRELETQLSEVLGRVSDAFYALDDEWRFTHLNERAAEIMQRSREELLGSEVWDVFPDAVDGVYWENLQGAMETQEPVSFEVYESGMNAWLEFNVYPSESGLSIYFQDVTGRKERERELAKYETIVETMNDGIYVKDEDGRFTMVNEAYAEMTGYDPEELVGEHASLVVDEETMEESGEKSGDGADAPMEATIETADGDSLPAEGTFASLETGEEVGVVRDITERKERERQLQERERQLSTLMDNVPGMVYRCRNERGWPMEFVSEGSRDLTGYDPEALERGETSYGADVVHEEDRDELWDDVQRGLDEDGTFLVTYRVVTADGGVRWVRERGRGILDEQGDLEAIEGVIIDVTDRKRLESELDEMFGRVTDAFFALDENWEFTYLNGKAHQIINPEGRELEGENIWEEFPDATGGSFQEEYERAMYEQETVTFEEYYPAPLDAWYEVSAYPSETGLSVYFRDISEQKEAQQQLEEERDMFAEGPAVVFRWDTEATAGWPVEYVSENVEDVLGYTPEELKAEGSTYTDLLHEEDLERIAGEVEAANAQEADRFTHEPYRVETKDGDTRWVKDITKIVRDASGDVDHYLGYLVDITEQKEHERELAQYETIVETVNDGIYVVDGDGHFTMVNEAYADMLGYDREELIGEHASLVVDEEVSQRAQEVEAKMATGEVEDPVLEAELETATGDRIPSEATFAVMSSAGGEQRRIGVARDVAERKEYQRRIEESERRYRTLVENFPDGAVGLFDEDLRYTAVGGQFLDQVGIPAEERVGERISDIYPEELVEEVEPYFEAALDGDANSFEVELHDRHLFAHTLPVTDADGVIAGMLVVQDVTERREAQRELRESEAKFRMIAENLEEIVWMATPDAEEFLYVNPAFEDVWGTDRETLYDDALAFLESVHPGDRDRIEERFTDLPGEDFDEQYRVVQPDGEIRWVHSRGALVHDEDSGMTRIVGIGSDITGRVEHERELEELVDQLEESNERLERFAYVASHDLQEPLRMISNYLQLLERRYREELDEDAEEFIDFAVDGADRMRDMISDLLEYSRLDTEAQPFEPTDAGEVVENVLDDLQLRIEETDAEITVEDLPTIEADENQFEMVFQNLVSNAIKYSGDDPPWIEIDAERRDDEWLFSVADDGIGMEQAHAEEVFDVFNRLHSHDEYPGTGIGLAMCEKIVRHHGGRIWVESEPGEGATFYFSVPAGEGGTRRRDR